MSSTRYCLGAAVAMFGAIALAPVANAAPGLASEVYPAVVYKGEIEAEFRYGELTGGPDAGERGVTVELGYTPTDRFRVALLTEMERDPGAPLKTHKVAIEAVYHLGRIAGIDVGAYGEYGIGVNEPDTVEGKLLLQRRSKAFDARLNLIAEKALSAGERVELSYAASFDVPIRGTLRAGVAAFGELGTFHDFLPAEEHYAGPVLKGAVTHLGGHTLRLEGGYLFALGKARHNASGQLRFLAELEF